MDSKFSKLFNTIMEEVGSNNDWTFEPEEYDEKNEVLYNTIIDVLEANDGKEDIIKEAMREEINDNRFGTAEGRLYWILKDPEWWRKLGCTITDEQAKIFTDWQDYVEAGVECQEFADDWCQEDSIRDVLNKVQYWDILSEITGEGY